MKPTKHETAAELNLLWATAETEEEADEILNYKRMMEGANEIHDTANTDNKEEPQPDNNVQGQTDGNSIEAV